MTVGILMLLFSISIIVAVMCYEFYTTGLVNRFKFRYWFSIGFLNAFHISLALYYEVTGDARFQVVRWATFALMDVLYLEIFLRPTTFKHRRNELLVRVVFYYVTLLSPVLMFYPLNITIALLLAYITYVTKEHYYKWFTTSFILYAFTTIVPEVFGYGTDASFLMGVAFLLHLMLGVYKLYKLEKVEIGGSNEH